MSRIKKKLNEAPDQYLTTKPVPKQMSLKEAFSNSKSNAADKE
jgi:hypothetical protein